MKISSFTQNLTYNEAKVKVELIHESALTKEIRILLKTDQVMKEHKAPFPIVIHVLSGDILFGLDGSEFTLKTGDVISLNSNIPHNLKANSDSIVRLSLSKQDTAERVETVAK